MILMINSLIIQLSAMLSAVIRAALPAVLQEQTATQVDDLFRTIVNSLSTEFLFGTFDTWGNAIGAALDILVTATVIYFVLKLFDDSRTWQLLKGFVFILLLTVFCNAIGLNTINYLLSNSISVLIIGVVVIFQPEMRTALETVGRNSLSLINTVSKDLNSSSQEIASMIESIAVACDDMASTCTGALIVLERSTALGELIKNSPAPVIINGNITSATLEQIFYKNSPLHDGALLIRNGRIYAARCHVPLADTYHLRKDLGTRHRAAIGASEMGDAVAIVVSEERGSISIAIDGRIYVLENGDALRSVLTKILLPEPDTTKEKSSPLAILQPFKTLGASLRRDKLDNVELIAGNKAVVRRLKRHRLVLKFLSAVLSFVLFSYVQAVNNPLEIASFSQLPITVQGMEYLDEQGFKMSSSDKTVNLVLRARRKTINKIKDNPAAIIAYVSLKAKEIKEGGHSYPVQIKINKIAAASYRVRSLDPLEITVNFNRDSGDYKQILPGTNRRGSGGLEQNLSGEAAASN